MRYSGSFVIIGDSICNGVTYSEEKHQYIFLDEFFITHLKQSTTLKVNNLSKFCETLPMGTDLLKQSIKKEVPKVVLIALGRNDCDYKWDEIEKDPYKEHFPAVQQTDFEDILNDTIFSLARKNIRPVLMTLPPINADAYLDWVSCGDAHRKQQIKIWLHDTSDLYFLQEMYSLSISRIAEETKTPLIDVREVFLEQNDYKEFLCKDGVHPNEKGYELIDRAFEQAFCDHLLLP